MAKLDTRLAKMNGRHLALAARVTVANGLILISLWYVITLWVGDLNFFNQLQCKIRAIVWPGVLGWIRTQLVNVNSKEGLGFFPLWTNIEPLPGTSWYGRWDPGITLYV